MTTVYKYKYVIYIPCYTNVETKQKKRKKFSLFSNFCCNALNILLQVQCMSKRFICIQNKTRVRRISTIKTTTTTTKSTCKKLMLLFYFVVNNNFYLNSKLHDYNVMARMWWRRWWSDRVMFI